MQTQASILSADIQPRILRMKDAPRYLVMNKNYFNKAVRPLTELRFGVQGIAFDRDELDAWADDFVSRSAQTNPIETKFNMEKKTMSKKFPGLVKRGDCWHIDKVIKGRRVCQSTGTSDLEEAQNFLIHFLEEHRQATIYGVRPKREFMDGHQTPDGIAKIQPQGRCPSIENFG